MARPRPPAAPLVALFVAAGVLFWFFGPAADRADPPGPPPGPVRLLVIGDQQLFRDDGLPGWPTVARNVFSDRLSRPVDLTVVEARTADALVDHLTGLPEPFPDLVVASLGWEDGAPGGAGPDRSARGRVAELAARTVHPEGGFYLRPGPHRTSPVAFLERLGDAKAAAGAKGVRLVFVEQAARLPAADAPAPSPSEDGDLGAPLGDIAPTAAARPEPWIAILEPLTERARAVWWKPDEPPLLTPEGHRRIGGVVGEALPHHLPSGAPPGT